MSTVLVVDDSKVTRDLIEQYLSPVVEKVVRACVGRAAKSMALLAKPDVIILDLNLPDISGLEVCRQLKADVTLTDIPILFITAEDHPSVIVSALESGAMDFIPKPFNRWEFQARVRSALRMKQLIDTLKGQVQIDPMTQLGNRARFDESVEFALGRFRMTGQPFAVLMIDVDHFKALNDRYGHLFGDQVLCRIADAIRSCSRETDVTCRYGGEEFAMVLKGAEEASSLSVAQRILQAVRSLALRYGSEQVPVSCSVGVCCPTDKTQSESDVVALADAALYRAKSEGRDRYALSDNCTLAWSDNPAPAPGPRQSPL